MVGTLIECGLSITAINDNGQTLLMSAAASTQTIAAEWLIQHGLAVNAADNDGNTALHDASISSDDTTMTELLLAHGAEANTCNANGNAALAVAANNGNMGCARMLIAAGADVHSTNGDGISSLHAAIMERHGNIAKVLFEHGAIAVMNIVLFVKCSQSIDICSNCCCLGLTALMMYTTVDTVKVLLAAGADVHSGNDAGDTCLHLAARHKLRAPVVCLLIKACVDLQAVNNGGKTAADIAHDNGYMLIEQLLNRAAAQQQQER
jgi:ankyrin repeat protein